MNCPPSDMTPRWARRHPSASSSRTGRCGILFTYHPSLLSVLTPIQDIPDAKFHTDKRKQVNVRRGRRKDGIPISLRAMAGHVRSELMAEMVSVSSPVSFEDGDRVLKNALQRNQWHI